MTRLISFLFALAALAAPASTLAVTAGEVVTAHVAYCRDLSDANEIAEAYVKGGEMAANLVLTGKLGEQVTSGHCAARVARFRVIKLAKAHVNGDVKMNVIEVEDVGGSGIYYVVNDDVVTQPVTIKGIGLKPERNA